MQKSNNIIQIYSQSTLTYFMKNAQVVSLQDADEYKSQSTISEKDTKISSSIVDLEKVEFFIGTFLYKIANISSLTVPSDKVPLYPSQLIRLTSSIFKVFKNFSLLKNPSKFDQFTLQLGQLRRLLRINRLLTTIKQYVSLFQKGRKDSRSIFNAVFKLMIAVEDLNDFLHYLMQLHLLPSRNIRQRTLDLYFYECLIWTAIHSYDFLKEKEKTEKEKRKKIIYILKYFLDSILSYNDSSHKMKTINLKIISALSLISSLLGLYLVWV